MFYILILSSKESITKKKKKLNCRYALYKQIRSQSRSLWSGDVYHIKMKNPCGRCYSNWGHVPPFRNSNCVFSLVFFSGLQSYLNLLDSRYIIYLKTCYKSKVCVKVDLRPQDAYAFYSQKGFHFFSPGFSLFFFLYFGFQVTKQWKVSKGLTVNISTICYTNV